MRRAAEEVNVKEDYKDINALIIRNNFATEKREEFTLAIGNRVQKFIVEFIRTVQQRAFHDYFVILKAQDFDNFLEKRLK